MYHYLESSTGPNPFDDYYSAKHLGRIPNLRRLTVAQYESENVDTREELEWGNMMSNQRNVFLQKLVSSTEMEKKAKTGAPHFVTGTLFSHFSYQKLSIKRIKKPLPK
jgi:Ino eighty subunit 1